MISSVERNIGDASVRVTAKYFIRVKLSIQIVEVLQKKWFMSYKKFKIVSQTNANMPLDFPATVTTDAQVDWFKI